MKLQFNFFMNIHISKLIFTLIILFLTSCGGDPHIDQCVVGNFEYTNNTNYTIKVSFFTKNIKSADSFEILPQNKIIFYFTVFSRNDCENNYYTYYDSNSKRVQGKYFQTNKNLYKDTWDTWGDSIIVFFDNKKYYTIINKNENNKDTSIFNFLYPKFQRDYIFTQKHYEYAKYINP